MNVHPKTSFFDGFLKVYCVEGDKVLSISLVEIAFCNFFDMFICILVVCNPCVLYQVYSVCLCIEIYYVWFLEMQGWVKMKSVYKFN